MPSEFKITTDEDGYKLTLTRMITDNHLNGRFIANNFNAETVESMPSIPLRDDDILFCSYMKF